MKNLLREAIRMMLSERTRDIEWRKIANKAYDDLLRTVAGKSVEDLGMTVEWSHGVVFAHAPFEALRVDLPQSLKGLEFAVMIGSDMDVVTDGKAYPPEIFPFAPRGLLAVGINDFMTGPDAYEDDKQERTPGQRRAQSVLNRHEYSQEEPESINVGYVLQARRTVFVHEMLHQLDMNERPNAQQVSKKFMSDLEAKKYWDTEAEINAHLMGAFEDMLDAFSETTSGPLTKRSAKVFAPSNSALWRVFVSELPAKLLHMNGEQKLLRRYATRLTALWNDFVSSLPD